MYRILEKEGEIKERRNQLIRPHYAKPELIAEAPRNMSMKMRHFFQTFSVAPPDFLLLAY